MTGLSGRAAVDAAANAYYETEAYATQHIAGAYAREGARGTSLLTASLADAVARGARHAVSTNTPMSRPLFESAGFRLATTWTNLIPAL